MNAMHVKTVGVTECEPCRRMLGKTETVSYWKISAQFHSTLRQSTRTATIECIRCGNVSTQQEQEPTMFGQAISACSRLIHAAGRTLAATIQTGHSTKHAGEPQEAIQ